jgi:2-oxoglutarate ferredoxin oxidoreductase subunit delta
MKFGVTIDRERCKGCVLCVAYCPHTVLQMSKTLNSRGCHFAEVLHPEACTGCKQCVLVCPDVAIEIEQPE